MQCTPGDGSVDASLQSKLLSSMRKALTGFDKKLLVLDVNPDEMDTAAEQKLAIYLPHRYRMHNASAGTHGMQNSQPFNSYTQAQIHGWSSSLGKCNADQHLCSSICLNALDNYLTR